MPLLLVGIVILGIVVTASGADTRAQIEYLTELHDGASDISDGGTALSAVTTRLSTISRVEFTTAMDGIVTALAEAAAVADAEPPTAAVLPVRALYQQAVTAWEEGVAALSSGLLRAADNPQDNVAVDEVVAALALLRAGDNLWARLLADMSRDDMPRPMTPFPEIVMSPATGPHLTVGLIFVESARSDQNTLGLRPGLRVSSLVAEPEWQVDANDQAVVPRTDRITFSVVMSNVGNIDSESEQLVVVLEGGAETVELVMTVEPLAPERQVTLVFEPIDVLAGQVYQVTASIVVDSPDVDLEDNVIIVPFRVGDD